MHRGPNQGLPDLQLWAGSSRTGLGRTVSRDLSNSVAFQGGAIDRSVACRGPKSGDGLWDGDQFDPTSST